jgi:uncharacterized membrane protein YeaQ/YmgE (transglycosylase-associated protein family)
MEVTSLVMWIVVGAIGGWLAGYLVTRDTALRINDVVLGMIGAVVGGWLFAQFGGTSGGMLMGILAALVGAVLVAWIYRQVTGKSAM